MNLREILARRDAIRVELRGILEKHPDGAMPADVQTRTTDLEAEAGRLNDAERRQVLLDDLDRRAEARPMTEDGSQETATVYGLTPEQRMTDFVKAKTGVASAGLSAGRAIKGMITGNWTGADAEKRTMGGSTGAAGGFLLPSPISANVIDLARNMTVLINSGAGTIPMEVGNLRVVRVLTDPTAAWRGEGTAIAESDGAFGALNLTAHSLAALVRVDNELMEDAPNFASILDNQLAKVLALKLDYAGLYGSGVGQPLGLRNDPNVQEVAMGGNGVAQTSYDEILSLIELIQEANGQPTALVQSPRSSTKLQKLVTGIVSDKTKLVPPAAYTALRRGVSNQVSITETQGNISTASTTFIGDFSMMAIAIRQDITIELSREADTAFAQNQTLVRAIMRADIATYRPTHFGRLTGIL